MTKAAPHIEVCICTYKRCELLARLLLALQEQQTEGRFTYSILVVDNDALGSASDMVGEFSAKSGVRTSYHVQPKQNIALARNLAVEKASGDYIAFIDDDEFPIKSWLLTLYTNCVERNVDGVLGPVKPHFDVTPPAWVVKGKFYDRASYPTGMVIDWRKGRTGNVLLRKHVFNGLEQPFNPEFRNGEDQEFFHRVIDRGLVFIWCEEAVAYEVVPPIRWKRSFMLRRALLRGAMEPKTPGFGMRDVAKSILAVGAYTLALPFAQLLGHDKFMSLLVRQFDHLGKLLAVAGFEPVKEAYVTE